MLVSSVSSQCGAGVGALAFPAIGPAGVVAVRQAVAAVILGVVARPSIRGLRWAQWWPILALAASLAMMNLALYFAVERIGLGLAVSLEFLGPLTLALLSLRRIRDWAFALIAGGGVYVLILPGPSTDYLGTASGLLAGTCWAAYILMSRVVGQRSPGLHGTALATSVVAVIYAPVAAALVLSGKLWGSALAFAVAAGVLSSAIPYAADLFALRRVPAGLYAILASLNPVWAVLVGMVALRQFLALHEWIGMACIAAANVAVVASQRSPRVDALSPEVNQSAVQPLSLTNVKLGDPR
jgi:inner membrane transporter RhtA